MRIPRPAALASRFLAYLCSGRPSRESDVDVDARPEMLARSGSLAHARAAARTRPTPRPRLGPHSAAFGGGLAGSAGAQQRSWPGEVRTLGARLLHDFGPFVVRGACSGVRAQDAPKPRFPLFRLDGVLDAVLRSEPMAAAVPSADAAYGYVIWCSRRLGSDFASPAQMRSAEATARRHGSSEPVFIALGGARGGQQQQHAWATDRAWIAEFVAGAPAPRAGRGRGRGPASASGSSGTASAAAQASAECAPARRADAAPSPRSPAAAHRRRVPSAVRVALWNSWHGREAGVGSCHCCGCAVTQQDFEAGHIVAAAHGGGATLDNLRVLCRPCNRSMGSRDMRAFIAEHFGGPRPAAPAPPAPLAHPSLAADGDEAVAFYDARDCMDVDGDFVDAAVSHALGLSQT